ncbi:putative tail sheath protein [Erwinia phage vB_EamM_Stratton]|uniref:Putative tail sheath protein n=2 Tax=Erskinevirus EaH2 TaxID=2169883 RepID=A0A1B2IHD9_9CAUD|nr:tail sheath [Erwinia phage phiEaH2]AFQ96719.1 putative phage tail sheath protein [Erwinia phage phiEaH2]ANZ50701.1 putative tail sheath protein [Erwinia phage vB_EamM_Stratton]
MTFIPRNGAPLNNKQGWQDNSVLPLVRTATGDPIHKPLIFTFAARGVDNEAFPLTGDNALSLLGRSIFDLRGPYATFNTPYQAMFNANGNECMYQRLVPDDAKTAAIRVFADVLETKVPAYERINGIVQYDATGKPKVKEQVDGIVVVFRSVIIDSTTPAFKAGVVTDGTMTGDGGTKSKLYPLFDIQGPYAGADVNGFGFKMVPLNEKSSPTMASAYQNSVGGRMYQLQWFETLEGVTSPVVWKTLTGLSSMNFSFKPDAYYLPMRTQLDFDVIIPDGYRKTMPDVGGLPDYGPFEEFHIYRDNLETVLGLAQAAVQNVNIADPYMVDIFGGLDLIGQPYDGVQVNPATETGKMVFSASNIHYLQGGSDGTMGDSTYDELVRREMLLFPEDGKVRYDNELKYSLGCFWDSGFSFDTKEACVNFIGKSRNTFLTLCTHVFDQGRNDLQTEEGAKVALIELITSVPESSYYGTPAARGMVTGQTAFIRNSSYKKPVPMNYSIASFFSKYLGAGEGRAKPSARFSRGEETIIEDLYDLSMPWKGNEVYASDWDVSLITARSRDYYRLFIPAIQSIYSEDRSVLNNALFNFIMTYVYRVSDGVWADMSGENRMTDNERAKMIENKITERLEGRLDNIADVTPSAYFTADDKANGYSVTLDLNAYGGVLLTQFNTTIKVYRRES